MPDGNETPPKRPGPRAIVLNIGVLNIGLAGGCDTADNYRL
jgi:hypothetical protein